MTIREVQKRRTQLEEQIAEMVNVFETEIQLVINRIHVIRAAYVPGDPEWPKARINIECEMRRLG